MSWNSLTDRQKLLDRAIEQCGVKLDNQMPAFAGSRTQSEQVRLKLHLLSNA